MQIIQLQPKQLTAYSNNARTHTAEQIQQICAAIQEFGFTNPILIDEKNEIIAGHGRLQAAKKLKLKTVPCIQLTHLTPQQKRAYVIADNKIALNAGWNDELLKTELLDLQASGYDITNTGFIDDEITAILNDLPEAPAALTDEDDIPETPKTPTSKRGEIYQLGQHRLMCGDSTSPEDYEKLMGGGYGALAIN